jgi:hypothetical protein
MKFGIAAFLVIILLAAGYFLTRKHSSPPPPQTPAESISAPTVETNSVVAPAVQKPIIAPTVSLSPTNASPSSETNQEAIDARIDALMEASANSDSNSFRLIITALSDENPEIRSAARDAVIQFQSKDAIPYLKDIAAKTEDPREKVAVLDAIEFLELPTLSEILRQQRTNLNSQAAAESKP